MLSKKTIKTDLCVIGGGMSGLSAAIAAAREGIKVVLMHERPVLGGNASSEIRMWVCGARGENNRETGIIEEIMLENIYRNPTKNHYLWDALLYDFVCREKNITLLLNCTCNDAEVNTGTYKDGRDKKIIKVSGYQMTTQTVIDVYADYYADCSGDSILAPLTGASFRTGREAADEFGEDTYVKEKDSMTMGNSCLIQGRETTKAVPFTAPDRALKLKKEDFAGRNPDLYKENENFWYLELGGERDTISDAEEIASELIPLALGTWDYIKNSGEHNAENWELGFLGFLPGKRESRRMCGEYTITQTDISNDTQFEDTVAFGGWPLDDHFPDGFYHRGIPNTYFSTPAPYCIPYRILYSADTDNLFFAGRNISATHTALSSIRVMATCSVMGQAIGTAAAIAKKYGISPNDVYKEHMSELQDRLLRADCFLPNKKRKISEHCFLENMAELYNGEDRANRVYGNDSCGIKIKNGTSVKYTFPKPIKAERVHIVFDSDLNRQTIAENCGFCEREHSTRANELLTSPHIHMPHTLCREFIIELTNKNGTKQLLEIKNNLKRSYDIELTEEFTELSLTPVSNWGNTNETTVISFDFI